MVAAILQEPNQRQDVDNIGSMTVGDFGAIAKQLYRDHVIVMAGLFVDLVEQRD
ncbi:hypothetical protein [Rosistilla oblonga]|uniref:hypothetical protein n=1 Tax=Rosistilla oblonga TaxID=2527990 RepID=UPI0018D25251|nr:hypothetical protein [Rosistilla oblonga]